MQIRMTVSYHHTIWLWEWSKSRTLTAPNAVDVDQQDQQELSFIVGENAKWDSRFGRQFGNFLQN